MLKLTDAIQGYKLHMLSSNYSPITIQNYMVSMAVFARFVDDAQVNAITKENIINFFDHLRETDRTEATVQVYWKVIRSFYNWASAEFNINRPDDIPMPEHASHVVIPFTDDEIKQLGRACKTKRDRVIILLLLDTGLRISEAARLTVQDVDLEAGTIQVNPWRTGKKSRSRQVRIGTSARRALWSYISSRDLTGRNAPLIATRDEKPMDRFAIRNIIRRIAARTSVKNVHPHRFRHTFAIFYLRNGGDIFTLQELLGHSSLAMVRHYLQLSAMDLELAHKRASPVDNWRI